MKLFRRLCSAALIPLFLALLPAPNCVYAQVATHVVISELYGGGGNAGSFYKNDFIELYNPTASPVTMTNWSVQYASASASFSGTKTILNGVIQPHRFFLVQEAQGSGGSASLPAPDVAGVFNISSANGKIALAADTTTITGPADPAVVDFAGFGTANQYEGSAAAPPASNTASIERKATGSSTAATMATGGVDSLLGNGWDAGQNGADFVQRAAPDPQNSSSPAEIPPASFLTIQQISRSPFLAEVDGVDTVSAVVSGGTVTGVRLHITVNRGADDSSVSMSLVSGSTYRGVIPKSKHAANGNLVECFISATNGTGEYASSAATMNGYFTGTSTMATVKSRPVASIAGYGARIAGTVNVRTNTFAAGEGYLQDGAGGFRFYCPAGLPSFAPGRNLKLRGTLVPYNGAYEIADPGFQLVDTALGVNPVTQTTVTLPLTESPSVTAEGSLVAIAQISSAAGGLFQPGNYLFRNAHGDTVTVRIESNGGSNTVAGTTVPGSPREMKGILSFGNGFLRLLPRSAEDAGNTPVRTIEAAASGRWSDTAAWSGHRVPGAADHVTFSTPGVAVTIDLSNAQCNNLTMTGAGTANGPTLKFDSAGAVSLTVNGSLAISGGSGSGQGGRAKLTSNGNGAATLILKGDIATTTANSSSSGSAGLDMNEGTVIVSGAADTLRNSAGLRLGNLRIGDGSGTTAFVWAPSKTSTLVIRSLTVKAHGLFLIGCADDSAANDIGASSGGGMPTLTGGVHVEPGGALVVQPFPGGDSWASLNIDGGGIVNDGVMILDTIVSPTARSSYAIAFGGFTGAGKRRQIISGAHTVLCGNISVGSSDTIALQTTMQMGRIGAGLQCTLNGRMEETDGHTIIGTVVTSRVVHADQQETFGGVGCAILSPGVALDTTIVRRVTGTAVTGESGASSILRWFTVTPQHNTPSGASMELTYDRSELNGQDPATLAAWKSDDGGIHWQNAGFQSVSDTTLHVLRVLTITSYSAWAIADAAHPLGFSAVTIHYPVAEGWNLVSLPLKVPDAKINVLFPTAISPAFHYIGVYAVADSLQHGVGYWLKFPADAACAITGYLEVDDTVPLADGWNLIGALSEQCCASTIVEEPAGIVASRYFRYEKGYVVSDTLLPCRGYWVKANGAGRLIRSAGRRAFRASPDVLSAPKGIRLTISDQNGHHQSLCIMRSLNSDIARRELPPAPPDGCFDVRFSQNRFVCGFDRPGDLHVEVPLKIQSANERLTLGWETDDPGLSAELRGSSGERLALDGKAGTVAISRNVVWRLHVDRTVIGNEGYALSANYPNPFNPSTTVRFTIPHRTVVDMSVIDITGRCIRKLFSKTVDAGMHTAVWDGLTDRGGAAAAGIYVITMRAGGYRASQKIVVMK